MNYRFSENLFKETFNWRSTEEVSPDSCRITHHHNIHFKLFPFTANGKTPVVTDMKDVIGDFVKNAIGVESTDTNFQNLMSKIYDETNVDKDDKDYLANLIHGLFYYNDSFIADNIGLYAYKGKSQNSSAEKLAKYLNDVFQINMEDRNVILKAISQYPYNALEKLIIECLDRNPLDPNKDAEKYFVVFEDASDKFKKDFRFMLENGMSGPNDLSDLLSLYYLYYSSQTCIALDHFGAGSRSQQTPIYFALDWEKVSANRECCKGGWKELSEKVAHIFSHAVTLELLNQIEDTDEVFDYKRLSDCVDQRILDDHNVATEIEKITQIYTESVGDYDFNSIQYPEGKSETDSAMRYLFQCVNAQFINRKAANDKYVNKLLGFYRSRWLKNRKKAGLVFNLTEKDIIFLTKISIQKNDRIRLVDLFNEYEKRGVYLDNTSKTLLQDFFTRLNLLDKKSDSGDAQYVKRIL